MGRLGLQRYPVAVLAATGLAAGLVILFLFRDPVAARRVFFITLVLGGTPLVARTLWGMAHGRFAADVVAMLAIVGAALLYAVPCAANPDG